MTTDKEIYIVWGYSYENDWIADIYSTEDKANKAVEEFTAKLDPVEDKDRGYRVEAKKLL